MTKQKELPKLIDVEKWIDTSNYLIKDIAVYFYNKGLEDGQFKGDVHDLILSAEDKVVEIKEENFYLIRKTLDRDGWEFQGEGEKDVLHYKRGNEKVRFKIIKEEN